MSEEESELDITVVGESASIAGTSSSYGTPELPITMAHLNKRTTAATAIKRIATKVEKEGFYDDQFRIQQQLNSLQMHFDRFMAAHDALIAIAQPAKLESHTALWDTVVDLRNATMAKLQRALSTPELRQNNTTEDGRLQRSVQSNTMDLRLDPLAVPKFDGALQNWLAFKDAFETLVHSQDFPEAYKLGKLREAVQGDAVSLVGGMYTRGYGEVWKALIARYDSPKQLADIHVARFIGFKKQTVETTSALLTIVDTVRESFRAVTVMKLPVDKWDALAVPIVTSKLPTVTQQAWGMSRTSNDIPTLEELLVFVERRAHSLASDVLRWDADNNNNKQEQIKATSISNRSLRLVKKNFAATALGNCEFCNDKTHRISRCPILSALPMADRFQRLKGSKLCFNCLKPGHATKACGSTNCRQCDGRHHTLLCRSTPGGSKKAAANAEVTTPTVNTQAMATGQAPQNYI